MKSIVVRVWRFYASTCKRNGNGVQTLTALMDGYTFAVAQGRRIKTCYIFTLTNDFRYAVEHLSFSEITDWQVFEDLVTDYFRAVRNDNEFNVYDVVVNQTGVGADGGRDILVTLNLADSIKNFERKWVVQCKFHAGPVGKAEMAGVNIPALIHEYGADGYLLVCKEHLTAPLTCAFENLNRNCILRYSYEFWHGTNFINRIRMKPALIASYFPRHQQFLNEQESKGLNLTA